MKKKFFKSTGFYLLIFSFLISIFPLILVQITFHRNAKQELELNIKTKIEKISRTASSLFYEQLKQEKEGIELLTKISPLKKEYIADYFFVYRKNFARISVLNPEGKELYSLVPNIECSSALPLAYDERLDLPGIPKELAERTTETRSLGLFPISDGYAERMLVKLKSGFILCDIRLSVILSNIARDLNLKSNEELFVIDNKNNVVFSQSPAYLNQKIPFEDDQKFISLEKESLLGFTKRDDLKFGLKVDYGSLLVSINQILRFGLLLTIILALFILLIISFSVRWFTQPLSSLIKGAEQISKGNFNQQIQISHPEELKILAGRFNEMAKSLKTLIKEKTQAESFTAIGKFASYFAHDLKSPLEGTYLITSEMRKKLRPDDPNKEYLEEVIKGIKRMRTLITGALDFSKAREPNLELIDLNHLIRDAASEFQESNPCQISLQLTSNLSPMLLDPFLFKRVFQNLFQNSFQARKNSCKIFVKTEKINDEILIKVRDNGKGIEKEILPNIFEPFTTSHRKGYGFGLAFVREVVKGHYGNITVESEPGRGTQFNIFLPARKK